eukprot:2689134-Amphidinium_carterae.1
MLEHLVVFHGYNNRTPTKQEREAPSAPARRMQRFQPPSVEAKHSKSNAGADRCAKLDVQMLCPK